MKNKLKNQRYQKHPKNAMSKTQLLYLKLLVYGYSEQEISLFLEINEKELCHTKDTLKKKFKMSSIDSIIIKSFKLGYLKKENVTHDLVKYEALKYAYNLIGYNTKTPFSSTIKLLSKDMLDFYENCNNNFIKTKFQMVNNQQIS